MTVLPGLHRDFQFTYGSQKGVRTEVFHMCVSCFYSFNAPPSPGSLHVYIKCWNIKSYASVLYIGRQRSNTLVFVPDGSAAGKTHFAFLFHSPSPHTHTHMWIRSGRLVLSLEEGGILCQNVNVLRYVYTQRQPGRKK